MFSSSSVVTWFLDFKVCASKVVFMHGVLPRLCPQVCFMSARLMPYHYHHVILGAIHTSLSNKGSIHLINDFMRLCFGVYAPWMRFKTVPSYYLVKTNMT